MKLSSRFIVSLFVFQLVITTLASSEESQPLGGGSSGPGAEGVVSSQASSTVPRLIKFSGTLKGEDGSALSVAVGVTFSMYKGQDGGGALWVETQTIQADAQGNYTVLLGASNSDGLPNAGGLPIDLFTSGESRWLGVQAQGQKEQARVLLVSVPYALKAGDAETLGGMPLSSFVLSTPNGSGTTSATYTKSAAGSVATGKSFFDVAAVTGGTPGRIGKFTNTTDLGDSAIFEGAGGRLGIGTASPLYPFHVESSSTATTGNSISFFGRNLANPASDANGVGFLSSLYQAETAPTAVNYVNGSTMYAFAPQTYHRGSGLLEKQFTVGLWTENSSTGFVVHSRGIDVWGNNASTGTIQNYSGVYVHNLLNSGTINNNHGVHIEAITSGTNNYAIYSEGGKSYFAGNVGIGTLTPTQPLEVLGDIKITGQTGPTGSGIRFADGTKQTTAGGGGVTLGANIFTDTQTVNSSTGTTAISGNHSGVTGIGVEGHATAVSGTAIGVHGQSDSSSGIGVLGDATATTGSAAGVQGQSTANNGVGVVGLAIANSGATFGVSGNSASTTGTGVIGIATAATGNTFGVVGESDSTSGKGIRGLATATSGVNFGGYFESSSTSGTGVGGNATATTGLNFGVVGKTLSGSGVGVVGDNSATSGTAIGVQGQSSSNAGTGVQGFVGATTGDTIGVRGQSDSISGKGVVGAATATSGISFGVLGADASTSGAGVSGVATASNGEAYGVYGLSSSTSGVAVNGIASATSGVTFGGRFESDSPTGVGVAGRAVATTGVNFGVTGRTFSASGLGIIGENAATSGVAIGVQGQSSSTTGTGVVGIVGSPTGPTTGVQGRSDSTSGLGVLGNAAATSGVTYGVYGLNASSSGTGVIGYATAVSGSTYGVYGLNASSNGTGVIGYATAASGTTYGVYGQAASESGSGVFGRATASGGKGLNGEATIANGIGVYGRATAATGSGTGLWGITDSTSGGIGVRGSVTAVNGFGNYAGYFTVDGDTDSQSSALFASNNHIPRGKAIIAYGDVQINAAQNGGAYALSVVGQPGNTYLEGDVTMGHNLQVFGQIIKGSGNFKIDHPLDPANKYLSHSFVESPDMMNIYNGNIVTDGSGEAVVVLPDYFEVLNRDFRYQLTVIGQFAQAIVAQEIQHKKFSIKTDKPNVKVSWQVTGVRQDPFANTHRLPNEEVKDPSERGFYLHPELYGQPVEKGIEYARQHPSSPARDTNAEADLASIDRTGPQ